MSAGNPDYIGRNGVAGVVAVPFNNALASTTHGIAAAVPAVLVACSVTNKNAALRYLQFFNQVADLAGGEVPVAVYVLAAGSATVPTRLILDGHYFGGGDGYLFTKGLVWGLSTTEGTFTVATAADHEFEGFRI